MSQLQLILEKQWIHILFLVLLLIIMAVAGNSTNVQAGKLWGVATPAWFWLAVAIPILHQVFVWLCWRLELYGSVLTRLLKKSAFYVYSVVFSVLGILRVIIVFTLAVSNRNTIALNHLFLKILAVVALIPAVYLFYSVKRYFSVKRAFGIDHFDAAYRSMPLVRKGIFRYTRNGMYTYGFLILWVPAFWYASLAALCVAMFNHIYIWIHYYTTELPDMKRIYREERAISSNNIDL